MRTKGEKKERKEKKKWLSQIIAKVCHEPALAI